MDAVRIGRSIRAIRLRLGWRQSDLGAATDVSRSFVSKIERGLLRHTELDRLERICEALGADLDMRVRWRGEGLDRLLDEAHASLVDRMVRELREAGWEAALEVTFNEYGDRGSVDIVGWHPSSKSILIIEIKSVVADAQGTLMPLDRKTRLGAGIGRLRGWEATTISKLLVVADSSTNRRRVARLASTFDVVLPLRNVAIRRWLRAPVASIAGLLFLPDSSPGGIRHASGGSAARESAAQESNLSRMTPWGDVRQGIGRPDGSAALWSSPHATEGVIRQERGRDAAARAGLISPGPRCPSGVTRSGAGSGRRAARSRA
jgi:transcriptional regulator with XRE-family HTH domain